MRHSGRGTSWTCAIERGRHGEANHICHRDSRRAGLRRLGVAHLLLAAVGRAPRLCDLPTVDCLSDRPRSLVRVGCHQSDIQTYENARCCKGGHECRHWRAQCAPPASSSEATSGISSHGSATPLHRTSGCVRKRERGPTSVFLFFIDPPVHRWTAPRIPTIHHELESTHRSTVHHQSTGGWWTLQPPLSRRRRSA